MHGSAITNNTKYMSAIINFHADTPLDLAQVLIKLATEIGQLLIIGGFERKITGVGLIVQNGIVVLAESSISGVASDAVRCGLGFADNDDTAQGIGHGLGNLHIDKITDEPGLPAKIYHAIIFCAPRQLQWVLA